jgi:hypothetical protein
VRPATILPAVLLVVAAACGGTVTSTAGPSLSASGSVAVAIPNTQLPGMHHRDATLNATDAAADATHPDAMSPMLSGAGLVGVRERTYTGLHGAFARVVIRAWVFASPQGAGAFLDWVRVNASHELIGEAAPISPTPGGTVVWRHDVTGCCHGETPIYLAAWHRGPIVWTARASGPRIRTTPVLELVRSIEQEV